jgi:hypothetical protein
MVMVVSLAAASVGLYAAMPGSRALPLGFVALAVLAVAWCALCVPALFLPLI